MKILILLFTVVFVFSACEADVVRQVRQNTVGRDSPPVEVMDNEEPHPISLRALSEKNFDGRDLELGQVLADNAEYTRYFISYKSGDLDISGIMNVPKGEGPFPVLILNHGYIDPAIYTNGRGLKREQDYFARQGYVVIHPDYRNHAASSKVEDSHMDLRLGYTEDVINAVYAVQNSELEFFDKENIGMLGHSMGGGITQNILVTKPDLIDAAVLYAPVSADYRDNFNKWTRSDSEQGKEIIAEYGDLDSEFWDNMSPIFSAEMIEVPILIQHGTGDESCPIEWSEKFVEVLESSEKNVTFNSYEGAPHEFIQVWPQFMESNTAFFDQYLK